MITRWQKKRTRPALAVEKGEFGECLDFVCAVVLKASTSSRGALPGSLSSLLGALSIHGYATQLIRKGICTSCTYVYLFRKKAAKDRGRVV
jgi:hypothetical protein